MNQKEWNLIAKHLAKETNELEEEEFLKLIETDISFKKVYNDSNLLWEELQVDRSEFDRKRIMDLRDRKIKLESKKQRSKVIRMITSYAAIFIGVIIGSFLVYNDLNSTITYSESGVIDLPDGSKITLNKNASIRYNNSNIKSFNREVEILNGIAFFEIEKQKGENFIVITDNYNIEVIGTKFNVSNSSKETVVVLDEGKVLLSNYSRGGVNDMELVPGDKVVFGVDFNEPQKDKVNTEVSKYWMKSKIHFDDYSLQDLKDIFMDYYGKTLVINNSDLHINKIGGSAPSDDIEIIMKGLSIVLKQDLVIKNDSIIIN